MSDADRATESGAADSFAPHANRVTLALHWYSRRCASWTMLFVAAVGVPTLYFADLLGIDEVNVLGQYLALAIVAVSLDLVWGYAGVLCLCQAYVFSLAGYPLG